MVMLFGVSPAPIIFGALQDLYEQGKEVYAILQAGMQGGFRCYVGTRREDSGGEM